MAKKGIVPGTLLITLYTGYKTHGQNLILFKNCIHDTGDRFFFAFIFSSILRHYIFR